MCNVVIKVRKLYVLLSMLGIFFYVYMFFLVKVVFERNKFFSMNVFKVIY